MKRLLWQSLWMLVPFAVLVGLSWNAWRVDARSRRMQSVEAARAALERVIESVQERLGPWSAFPGNDGPLVPPVPPQDPAAAAAQARYDAGDYEGVLGSPASVRSAAGLPLRSLAALQLLRRETDPAQLTELAEIITSSTGYVSPLICEDAERRFAELGIAIPAALKDWRYRWDRTKVEGRLTEMVSEAGTATSTQWLEWEGKRFLIERRVDTNQWRVHSKEEIEQISAAAVTTESRGIAEGLKLSLGVAGTPVVAVAGGPVASYGQVRSWRGEVVADEAVFERSALRSRKILMAILGVAGLAMAIGLTLSIRGTLRALELARRQGEFMAAVSHEMRTPLAAMRLLAENLESGVAERAGQSEQHLRMIRQECGRLGTLVGNVLEFNRRETTLEFEPFDIRALMFEVDEWVRPLAEERRIAFETRVEAFPDPPAGDAEAIRRALVNLADNALKHSPDGGSVRCHAAPAGGGKWSLIVTDHGPGIPARERKKIFDPFYRIGDELRRTTPGTGLGLALVKRTATAHHGTIAVDDAPGGGARFTLTLPLRPDLL